MQCRPGPANFRLKTEAKNINCSIAQTILLKTFQVKKHYLSILSVSVFYLCLHIKVCKQTSMSNLFNNLLMKIFI